MGSMSRICLINMPSGLGDIFFTQKIMRTYLDQGYRVIHPVIKHYTWLKDYISDIEFPSEEEEFPYKEVYNSSLHPCYTEDFVYLPLKNCQNLVPIGKYIMEQKYQMVGIDHSDWFNFLKYKRNEEKEERLFHHLGLNEEIKYNLVVRNYQTWPNVLRYNGIFVENDLKQVELDFIPGYTLLDWCKVIEKASNLYMVDSCVCYLVETLKMSSVRNVLWPRNPVTKFIELKPIFNFPWEYQND